MIKIIFTGFFLLIYSVCFAQEYLDVTGNHQTKIPNDLYYKKDYRFQWWYFTGHLFDEKGREFGYELTFFIVNVQNKNYRSRFGTNCIYISHFAVSDFSGNRFLFSDKSDAGAYGFAGAKDNRLKVWVDKNMLDGTVDKILLKASDNNKSIDLQLVPVDPLILNGENGYFRKSERSPATASYYFSYTHLKTEGRLAIGNNFFTVKGKSWFDREIMSDVHFEEQAAWDWFAIQLDDNREVMLYLLRNKDGSIDRFSAGTFVYNDGKYRHLSLNDFSVKVLDHFKSEKTGARYPSEWKINIPSEKLEIKIKPLMKDQEVLAYYSTGNYYWEGACNVEGSAKGKAYVEMTGY
jgi:predicted secreted hydrolase